MSVCLFDSEDDFAQGGYVQGDYGENHGILDRAAQTAEAIVLSKAFCSRISQQMYPDRQWEISLLSAVGPAD